MERVSAFPAIRAELKLHPDVHTLNDEWSGITNPVIRRKLQNRLNQRAARRRKAGQKAAESQNSDTCSDKNGVSARAARIKNKPLHERVDLNDLSVVGTRALSTSQWHVADEESQPGKGSAFVSIRSRYSCQQWYQVMFENRMRSIEDLARRLQQERDYSWHTPLSSDHLITLVYYNVYRALLSNVEMLGLDLNLMYMDDYPSPFLPLSPSASSNIRHLPPGLQPTELQKTIAHHPQWDIFPDPVVRDNILRYGEKNIDDLEFCLDLVGDGQSVGEEECSTQEKNGLIVWGEPWAIDGWEVTEAFARKYPFFVKGAHSFQENSNRWRIRRGEEPLDYERICEIE
ncbi:hypothetical protein PV08_05381 [Exophiala spinifera]|uniref:BZIP domain-containing protein n=1 Tax=Exophiala spinifera TaxID=91928 RepID=A0A0D2B9L7_9EURO|nr:uncharacterized protein PV08_05381 [Exophiala spinifera]KIW15335.1 hypothetical protein PV08_05381 [Exophiala spinifera]